MNERTALLLLVSYGIVEDDEMVVGEAEELAEGFTVVGGTGYGGETYGLAVEVDVLADIACIDASHLFGMLVLASELIEVDDHEEGDGCIGSPLLSEVGTSTIADEELAVVAISFLDELVGLGFILVGTFCVEDVETYLLTIHGSGCGTVVVIARHAEGCPAEVAELLGAEVALGVVASHGVACGECLYDRHALLLLVGFGQLNVLCRHVHTGTECEEG